MIMLRARRVAGNLLLGFLPPCVFVACLLVLKNMIFATGITLVSVMILIVFAGFMQRNPWLRWYESRDIGVIELSGRGIMSFYPCPISQEGVKIKDRIFPFKRMHLFSMGLGGAGKIEHGAEKMKIELPKSDVVDSRWVMDLRPVLIYNGQTNQLMTKEFMSTYELAQQNESNLLQILGQVEKLNSAITYWARHILNQLAAAGNSLKNPKFWIIAVVVILVVVCIFAFGPKIMAGISPTAGSVGGFFQPR